MSYMFIGSILRLPLEITDMVVDFLHDDVKSLQACSLISRSWLPSSRFHLFRSCTIKDSAQFRAMFRSVTNLETSRDTGTYIRQLTIAGEGTHGPAGGLTLETFETLLRGLPRLRRLTIENIALNNEDDHIPASGLPQDAQRKAPFALEELQLLETKIPKADYSHLFRILALFSSIKSLALASEWRTVHHKGHPDSYDEHPHWKIASAPAAAPVTVQHLRTFNMPPAVMQALLVTSIATPALQTFSYDDHALDWTSIGSANQKLEVHQLGEMIASLPSESLHSLILGPLPIFKNAYEMRRGLTLLGSVRGLCTFHLHGRWVEPHLAAVFAALPDTVRDARFVVVGLKGSEGSRNRFRAFGEAFAPVLRERAQMAFVLDLGVLRRKFPQSFAMLKDRAEKGFLGLRSLEEGRLRIDDSPKELEEWSW
ncbi:hypothetical protein GSI_03223 [Ganoderma sinense ZZ0214-1]|uniref:F-box domain-containing protein n=1 Tax=Ganoderma sinense ZZ0214-1 TaxID=1077348 RepID=A0A2G8SL18_9APHY|nr:hypothetical protein GSI_03223 [Ganoderma sinense ZZ0214-1]